ncbi:MAG: response regulator with CheY-like receiver AAA-type ATPase and DNA-binding domain, partial [bacterium]
MKKNKGKILIVDDEVAICEILSYLVQSEDFNPLIAYNGDAALKTIRYESPDLVLLDFIMPGINGLEVIKHARELVPNLPIIMITAYGTIPAAVTAIKAGADNYLAKPFNHEEVIRLINLALAKRTLEKETISIETQEPQKYKSLGEVMGYSKSVNQIVASVDQVAKSNFTVLIQGETGSGKE